jgi:putative hemolysin
VWLLSKSTNGLLRLFGIDPEAEDAAVTEEEIRLLVDAGSARGSIDTGEKEIIHNVFEFDTKTAEEVMTHRRDVAFLWLKDDDEAWERIIIEKRHSYYPVCGEDVDSIEGILDAKDYLALKDRSRSAVLAQALKAPEFVPNTAGIGALFKKMKARRKHFAVVVDEYGGMDGVITMNDLLEELVGNIPDGDGKTELFPIEKISPGLWRISGTASLERVARETGAVCDTGKYDTFGGFVFTLLGRIPEDGERCELRAGPLQISLTEIKDHRLASALVRLLPQSPEKDPAGPSASKSSQSSA